MQLAAVERDVGPRLHLALSHLSLGSWQRELLSPGSLHLKKTFVYFLVDLDRFFGRGPGSWDFSFPNQGLNLHQRP